MVIRLDRQGRFRFATAQSPFGETLFRKHGLRTDSYETNLVLIDGVAFTRLDSFVAVMAELGWPLAGGKSAVAAAAPAAWLALRSHRQEPLRSVRQEDSCEIPAPDLRERFLG